MKKILPVTLLVLTAGFIWFLFIKKYDYQFKYTTQSGAPSAFQNILNLEEIKYNGKVYKTKIIKQDPYTTIIQGLSNNKNEAIEINWNFEVVNDSITQVKVNFLQPGNSLLNRIAILNPFSKSDYVKGLQNSVLDVRNFIRERENSYSINLQGKNSNPAMDCACVLAESTVEGKAFAMVANVNILMEYISTHSLDLQGNPLLKVRSWDREKNHISFDFCFPIRFKKDLPETRGITLKRIESQASLMAIFNGNYRDSHLSWLEIIEKANRDNIDIVPLPLEIYYNNPMMGGEAIDWRADVYLPLK